MIGRAIAAIICPPAMQRYLAAKVAQLTSEQKSALADLLFWRDVGQPYAPGYSIKRWREESPALFDALSPHLSLAAFREVLKSLSIDQLLPGCNELPEHLLATVADRITEDSRGDSSGLLNRLMHTTGHEAISPLVLKRIAETRRDYDWMFTRELWSLAPDLSLQLALQEWKRDPDSELTGHWFSEAPKDLAIRRPLLDAVRERAARPPCTWLRIWLLRMLPSAGPLADTIYALMRGAVPQGEPGLKETRAASDS